MLHKKSDEGSIIITNGRYEILKNKSDKGNTSIMQEFEDT